MAGFLSGQSRGEDSEKGRGRGDLPDSQSTSGCYCGYDDPARACGDIRIVKGKLVLLAVIILAAICIPVSVIAEGIVLKDVPVKGEIDDTQHNVDIEWLREEILTVFQANRVDQMRVGNEVTYHAPYLHSMEGPPSSLPGWLHWAWETLWHIKEPVQVRYPHQFFWDSCSHAITLSHLALDLAKEEVESLLAA